MLCSRNHIVTDDLIVDVGNNKNKQRFSKHNNN